MTLDKIDQKCEDLSNIHELTRRLDELLLYAREHERRLANLEDNYTFTEAQYKISDKQFTSANANNAQAISILQAQSLAMQAQLNTVVQEKQTLEATLTSVYNSSSWKLTGPIRLLGDIVKEIIRFPFRVALWLYSAVKRLLTSSKSNSVNSSNKFEQKTQKFDSQKRGDELYDKLKNSSDKLDTKIVPAPDLASTHIDINEELLESYLNRPALSLQEEIQYLLCANEYKPGTELSFSSAADEAISAAPYMVGGFSTLESEYTWTLGHEAKMLFLLPRVKSTLDLQCTIKHGVFGDRQKVIIKANGIVLFEYEAAGLQQKEFTIPYHVLSRELLSHGIVSSDDLNKYHYLFLTFELPDAISPLTKGITGDQRVLGLSLRSLCITETAN